MIRKVTLGGADQGSEGIRPLVFEISAKIHFWRGRQGQKFKKVNFSNFVKQGIDIGVFRPTESISGVYFTLKSLVLKLSAKKTVILGCARSKIQIL